MSAPRKINDHSSWVGKGSKGSVFPEGVKTKMESSAEGAGHLASYDDKTEDIRRDQSAGDSKAKSHATKPGYRY